MLHLSAASFTNFFAACAAVGTAATMALAGVYIHRRGFVTDDGKKTLAIISQQVTIPALLFSRIVYCQQGNAGGSCPSITDMMNQVWMLTVWPIYVVSCGLIVGHFVTRLSNTPKSQRKLVLAACAFGNSTGLPITLLTVIHNSFPSSSELGRVDPTLFLSLYLLTYPILQWGVGGWIIDSSSSALVSSSPESGSTSDLSSMETAETDPEMMSLPHQEWSVKKGMNESCPLIFEPSSSSYTTVTTEEEEKSAMQSLIENIRLMASKSLQPPVFAALFGILVVSIYPLRKTFVDMEDFDNDAPLEFLFDGIYAIGQAAVPINMMILGMNLSKTFSNDCQMSELLSRKSTTAVVIGKMVIMPIIGICSTMFLRRYLWDIPDAIDDAFYLVLMIVFITPTANNVMVMVELGGKHVSKEGIARLIGWQYALAPVLLSVSVATVVHVVSTISDW
mmetsp:Transcript_8803/g.12763  ORF Transcript_8803/g.12763 Transcript_8803/m.12763 type:complete len:449 (-) Transcript_8803:93-1439(-)